MAGNLLRTTRAVQVSVFAVRAFIRMRSTLKDPRGPPGHPERRTLKVRWNLATSPSHEILLAEQFRGGG